MFGASAAAEGQASRVDHDITRNAKAAGGWAIFVGVIAFIYEVFFIITRFLVFPILVEFRTLYLIVVK